MSCVTQLSWRLSVRPKLNSLGQTHEICHASRSGGATYRQMVIKFSGLQNLNVWLSYVPLLPSGDNFQRGFNRDTTCRQPVSGILCPVTLNTRFGGTMLLVTPLTQSSHCAAGLSIVYNSDTWLNSGICRKYLRQMIALMWWGRKILDAQRITLTLVANSLVR